MPRSNRGCPRPATHTLNVEATGEKVHLCPQCAHLYEQGAPITYAPRRPG